jgi:PadR family transcriptional regulator, regulatory protein PadR
VAFRQEDFLAGDKAEILQGTLDLMVLKTLEAMGPQHGYGIARRIEQVSAGMLELNQGTIYAALLRLQQKAWISAQWGASDNNRRAKFYSITRAGRRQLQSKTESWEQLSSLMGRFLRMTEKG